MTEIRIGGLYKHFKTGNLYKLIATAKHSETLEDVIVYECIYDNPESKIWVRPREMFLETVTIDGKEIARFELID